MTLTHTTNFLFHILAIKSLLFWTFLGSWRLLLIALGFLASHEDMLGQSEGDVRTPFLPGILVQVVDSLPIVALSLLCLDEVVVAVQVSVEKTVLLNGEGGAPVPAAAALEASPVETHSMRVNLPIYHKSGNENYPFLAKYSRFVATYKMFLLLHCIYNKL